MDLSQHQARRTRLITELWERVRNIQLDIVRLESTIISATEEKENLNFHLQLLEELGGFETKSEDEAISMELWNK
jgi:hypothetical protein